MIGKVCGTDIMGMTEEEARKLVESKGMEFRVSSREMMSRNLTYDLRPTRLNAEIINGRVVSVREG
jgi:hypothetical protein